MSNLAQDILDRVKFAKDTAQHERRATIQMPRRSRIAQLLVDRHFCIIAYRGKEVLAENTSMTAYKIGWPEGTVVKDPLIIRRATEDDLRKHPYFGAIYV